MSDATCERLVKVPLAKRSSWWGVDVQLFGRQLR